MSTPEIPIIPIGDSLLISLQGEIADQELVSLKNRLFETLSDQPAQAVVLDVSGLSILDSFMARTLDELARGGQIKGTDTYLVGIQPEVAITLVEMGLSIPGVKAEHSVEAVLDRLSG